MITNARRFKRNKMKGIMTSTQCLKHIYSYGPREAIKPKHETIQTLVNSGFVTVKGQIVTITDLGKKYVADRFPSLKEFQAPEED